METAIPVVTEVVNKISSIDITNIDEAKKDYKELEKFIKNQKSTVEEALKSGAYDVAQSAGAELVNTVRTKLNESMEYYVNLRSKLNPLGSWVEFRNYVEYTSMISSIYFIRQNLVSWFNKITKKLENM
jgi:D-aminopeptidase